MTDAVNHPKHYTSDPSGIECIQITRHRNFNVGNAIKYLWRAGLKDDANMSSLEKQIEDLDKTIWYVKDEKQRLLEMAELEKAKKGQASENFCLFCKSVEQKFTSIPVNYISCNEHDGREVCLICHKPILHGQDWEIKEYDNTYHQGCLSKQIKRNHKQNRGNGPW